MRREEGAARRAVRSPAAGRAGWVGGAPPELLTRHGAGSEGGVSAATGVFRPSDARLSRPRVSPEPPQVSLCRKASATFRTAAQLRRRRTAARHGQKSGASAPASIAAKAVRGPLERLAEKPSQPLTTTWSALSARTPVLGQIMAAQSEKLARSESQADALKLVGDAGRRPATASRTSSSGPAAPAAT